MSNRSGFRVGSESRILTPRAAGLEALVSSVKAGRTIVARQVDSDPVSMRDEANQTLVCESSGTGGTAKCIRRSPESWIRSFEVNRILLGVNSRDTYAALGHLGHSLTLFAVMEALHIGAGIALLSGMLPASQVQRVMDSRASVIYATPTQLHLFVAGSRKLGVRQVSGIRRLLVGGGKLGARLATELIGLFPDCVLHEFYGSSETSFVTISDELTPEGSVGKPYPGVSLRIGRETPAIPHVEGKIWVSSPYLFERYEVEDSKLSCDGAYVSVGDRGFTDENGYLFLSGRTDRTVSISDVNVNLDEIEQVISSLEGIGPCAVIPRLDERNRTRIVAFIEGKGSAQLAQGLRHACMEGLSPRAIPRRFIFLDRLPVLPAGKPDYRKLNELAKACK